MNHRQTAAVLATVVATAALPATASAKTPVSAKSGASAQVAVHVAKADKAIKRLKRAAKLGATSTVLSELKIARAQTASGSKEARKMTARATTDAQDIAAAQSLALTAVEYDDLVEVVTGIVDVVPGRAQASVANAISPSIAGKAKVIGLLETLLDEVPEYAQGTLAALIAGLSVGDATELVNLDQALKTGNLPVNISAIVTQALAMATSVMGSDLASAQSLVPSLPTAAQGPLKQILAMVPATGGTPSLGELSIVTGLIHTLLGSLPVPGVTSATGGLGKLTGLLNGIVGGSATGLPVGVEGTLEGLLGSLLGGVAGGGIPAAGVLDTVTELIEGLLGGVLPGAGSLPGVGSVPVVGGLSGLLPIS